MEKKLSVNNLVVSFRTPAGKVQAVRDISFDLNKGETLAIVGESGSGKSVTSKAILGILAGNSIIEGGSIIYDGMDLLKIGEDDFYRIRGDKIAMIFQDPLSSLNPIMRVGKQLTEAMLLKGKAHQKASRNSFNQTLALLEKTMAALDKTKLKTVALAGGVAANSGLREAMEKNCLKRNVRICSPAPGLCTDNGAMIGCRAYYMAQKGDFAPMTLNADPRLPFLAERGKV